jgi:hypothetical protein
MVMAIVVSAVITGLISVMCWVATEQTARGAALRKSDQAFYAAEAGAQRVQWYCKHLQMDDIAAPLTGDLNGYHYATSWNPLSGSTIQISSIGNADAVSYSLSVQVTPPFIPQPAIQSMGDFDNKNIIVTGDIIAGGNYTNGGSGSLTGNLTYYGTASNTRNVSGALTPKTTGTPYIINFPTLINTLKTQAGRKLIGNQNNQTFDFTAIPGPHKVIYVDGNVANPSFLGSGTLVVTGNISGAGDFGAKDHPVNLVAAGNINTSNNTTIYGALYAGGNWDRGKFNLTGIVYVAGIVKSNNGKSYLTQAETPWFDPRATSGDAGRTPTLVSNFSGPTP